jgi:tetratricopeptide (TPR) repeat protein
VEYGLHPYEVEREEAAAWVAYAEGRNDEAVKTLRAAADREDSGDGPDLLVMPAREMLGDLLLESSQPALALVEYEAALKESPNRFDGLYGAARAAELSGDTAKARRAYQNFLALWKDADPDIPILQQAKAEYAKLQ